MSVEESQNQPSFPMFMDSVIGISHPFLQYTPVDRCIMIQLMQQRFYRQQIRKVRSMQPHQNGPLQFVWFPPLLFTRKPSSPPVFKSHSQITDGKTTHANRTKGCVIQTHPHLIVVRGSCSSSRILRISISTILRNKD